MNVKKWFKSGLAIVMAGAMMIGTAVPNATIISQAADAAGSEQPRVRRRLFHPMQRILNFRGNISYPI